MLMIKKACFFALQNFSFEENNRGNIYYVLKCSFPTERRIWHMWNLSATNVYNYSSSDAATAFSNESKKKKKALLLNSCMHAGCLLPLILWELQVMSHDFSYDLTICFYPHYALVLNNSGFFNPLSKTPKSENFDFVCF